jgi:Spy/CpxP family protein refolding chaperone
MRTRAAIYLIVVFVLGALAGIGGERYWCHRRLPPNPQAQRQAFIARMQQRLDLTPQQTAQFAALVDETMQRFGALHKQMEPQFEQIRDQQREKIRAILNPQQQQKFDAWMSAFDKRRRLGPPHPPMH